MAELALRVTGLEPLTRVLSGSGADRLGRTLGGLRETSDAFRRNVTEGIQSLERRLGSISDTLNRGVGNAFQQAERSSERIKVEQERTARTRARLEAQAADRSKQAAIEAGRAIGVAEANRLKAQEIRLGRERLAATQAIALQRRQDRERQAAWDRQFQERQAAERKLDSDRAKAARERQRQEKQALREQAQLARRISGVGGFLGRSGLSVGRGIGGIGGVFGGALGGLAVGGGGPGGLLRSVAGAGSGILSGGGGLVGSGLNLGGSLFSGGATALGSLAGPIGGAVGSVVGGIGKGITGAISGALESAAAAGSGVLRVAGDLGGAIADKIGGVVKVGLVGAVAIGIASVVKASQFESIEQPFRNIAQAVGSEAVPALESMREATRGTVSDLDLMTQFNRSVQLGAARNVSEFNKLAESSRRLGKAVGRDAGDALEDITLGLGRQSKVILDNIGITLSAEGAYQRYAESVGKSSAALTDAEKKQAFLTAALKATDEAVERLGPEVDTFSDKWNRFTAGFENLLVNIGRPLLDVLSDLLPHVTSIGNGFSRWLSENRVEIAARLRSAVSGVERVLRNISELVNGSSPGEFFDDMREAAKSATDYLTSAFEEASLRIERSIVSGVVRAVETSKGEIAAGLVSFLEAAIENPLSGIGLAVKTHEFLSGRDLTGDLRRGTGIDSATLRGDAAAAANQRATEATAGLDQRIAELVAKREGAASPLAPFLDRLESIARLADRPATAGGPFLGGGANAIAAAGLTIFGSVTSSIANGTPGLRDPRLTLTSTGPAPGPVVAGAAPGLTSTTAAGFGKGPSAEDLAALTRSGLQALETLAIDLNELPPPLADKLRDAIKSEEGVQRLREAAADHLAGEYERTADAELKGARERLREAEQQATAFERAAEAQRELDEQRAEVLESIAERLADQERRIEENLDRTLTTIAERTQDRIRSVVDSAFNNLAGLAGGLEADGGIPRNIRLAARKVRRQANNEREDRLKRRTSGLSADDLAANNGALLRQVLRAEAEFESAGRVAEISARGIAEAGEARAKAEADFKAAADEAAARIEEAARDYEESSRVLAESLGRHGTLAAEAIQAVAANQRQLVAQLENQARELARIKESVTRATRLASR